MTWRCYEQYQHYYYLIDTNLAVMNLTDTSPGLGRTNPILARDPVQHGPPARELTLPRLAWHPSRLLGG
jgi:hypothetical protein